MKVLEDEFEPLFDQCKERLKGKKIALFGSIRLGRWGMDAHLGRNLQNHRRKFNLRALSFKTIQMKREWKFAKQWEKCWRVVEFDRKGIGRRNGVFAPDDGEKPLPQSRQGRPSQLLKMDDGRHPSGG